MKLPELTNSEKKQVQERLGLKLLSLAFSAGVLLTIFAIVIVVSRGNSDWTDLLFAEDNAYLHIIFCGSVILASSFFYFLLRKLRSNKTKKDQDKSA